MGHKSLSEERSLQCCVACSCPSQGSMCQQPVKFVLMWHNDELFSLLFVKGCKYGHNRYFDSFVHGSFDLDEVDGEISNATTL